MGRIKEYLKLIPKGLLNADKVIDGIRNNIKLENGELGEEIEDQIIARRLICSQCSFMSANQVKAGIYKTDRQDNHCTLCSCNIELKTSCLICNCGIEEYNKKNPENQLELKWKKIN